MRAAAEIFLRFLGLGCMAFGGPAAHIGIFRTVFVERLRWLDDSAYARTVALSQFLPGPGSSQVGFALGLHRGGLLGGFAAFVGFTLPSFALMLLLSVASAGLPPDGPAAGAIEGLKLLAVVVVTDAVWSMARTFCTGMVRPLFAAGTAAALLLAPGLGVQFAALVAAAVLGIAILRPESSSADVAPKKIQLRLLPLLVFVVLFVGLPGLPGLVGADSPAHPDAEIATHFYEAGSLVFGGGHVVLPLLQTVLGDAVPSDRFLIGYAGAQAVPGPMFSFGAFLGAELQPDTALWGALLATVFLFLPGFLLVLALREGWEALASRRRVAGAVSGLNAAVVGLLLAGLVRPVVSDSIHGLTDVGVVLIAGSLLRGFGWKVGWVALACAVLGAARAIV